MKPWLFNVLIFAAFPALGQEEPEHVKIGIDTTAEVNYFPHIGPFYEGEIPVIYLSDPDGIQAGTDLLVISYSISYPYGNQNKIVPVKGNRIPEEIIRDIFANSLGEMIFITNIVTLNDKGKRVDLVPMTLIPVKE